MVSLAALGYGAWVIFEELVYDIPVPGYPTVVVSIMFFAGVQLISLGVISEYLGRVFDEVKQRPRSSGRVCGYTLSCRRSARSCALGVPGVTNAPTFPEGSGGGFLVTGATPATSLMLPAGQETQP